MKNNIENRFSRVPNEQEQKAIDMVVNEVFNLHAGSTKKQQLSHHYTGEIIRDSNQEILAVKARMDEEKDAERDIRSDISVLAMDLFAKNNRVPDSIDLWNSFKNYQKEDKKQEKAA